MAAIPQPRLLPESNRLTTCALPLCSRLFAVCRGCDHGRRYCGPDCAAAARRARQRHASRVYQSTERGRLAHAARQARYRTRKRVTHPSTSALNGCRGLSKPSQTFRAQDGLCQFRSGTVPPHSNDRRALDAPQREMTKRLERTPPAKQRQPPECVFCGATSVFLRSRFLTMCSLSGRRWPYPPGLASQKRGVMNGAPGPRSVRR